MSHAELCPVCNGKGYFVGKEHTDRLKSECHGCQGLGWVTVYDGDYKVGYSGGTNNNYTVPTTTG